ncbi:MAG: C40 family peptidase [Acidobacteriaceae bacterium]
MASHINSVASSDIPQVTKVEFYEQIRWGDMLFCSGREPVSRAIQCVTHSPFSHVLFAWLPAHAGQWLTLEATMQRGVHVGKLSDYLDSYDGDLVLARRSAVTDAEKFAELNAGLSVLEDAYDWQQELSFVGHKLIRTLPVVKPKGEYYCSGLMWLMSLASNWPLQMPGPELPAPEDNWTDPSVGPVCAIVKPTHTSEAACNQIRCA